uniref:Calpastatin n=1 Tax=Panagrellus redivivus TaxID=6233 RepID=A0A7E4V6Q2_PANRE
MASPSKPADSEPEKNVATANEPGTRSESDKTAREPGCNSDPDKTAREPASEQDEEVKEIRKADARSKIKESSYFSKGGLEEFDYTMLKKP